MLLSVIILNYNVRYFLEHCLLSVQKSLENIEAEIIVVDNASADDSCQMLKDKFPGVTLIENKENTGFPKGNNIGVAQAKGKYICILNPDTVVAEDTFLKIIRFAESQNNLGIIGCKLIDGTGNFLPESKRNVPTPKVSLQKLMGNQSSYYANHLGENQTGEAAIFVGAFMFLEKAKYQALGGFDETFFMYGEDVDLSYRFLKEDYANFYFGETSIIHYKGESTLKDEVYLKRFYGAMKIFYKKHFKTNVLIDWATTIGIWAFSTANRFKSKEELPHSPNLYILISDNTELRRLLTRKLLSDIDMVSNYAHENFKLSANRAIELIFDNNFMSYQDIISFMEKHKNKGYTFKIRPRDCNFIIGSNDKNDKGKAIDFGRYLT
ncbi:MAG TPA: glycosyltransferase family 2 protein [Flavobacterium sp.]|nr:glycosyltransferase family 2 protein [Flavobacterium sp.]